MTWAWIRRILKSGSVCGAIFISLNSSSLEARAVPIISCQRRETGRIWECREVEAAIIICSSSDGPESWWLTSPGSPAVSSEAACPWHLGLDHPVWNHDVACLLSNTLNSATPRQSQASLLMVAGRAILREPLALGTRARIGAEVDEKKTEAYLQCR